MSGPNLAETKQRYTKNNDVNKISIFTKASVDTFMEVAPKLMNVSND